MMLGRGIRTLYVDIKKKRETKQRRKREQQRLSEQPHGSAPSIREERLKNSDDGHTLPSRDGGGNPCPRLHMQGTVSQTRNASQTVDWIDTGPLEDILPKYEHGAARLPTYEDTLVEFPRRRDREHDEQASRQIHESRHRARACTGIRIRTRHGLDVEQGAAVMWYDALEDQYEIIA